MPDEVQWNLDELRQFARRLGSDKDGRALKKQMEEQFNSITETLRDRLREGIAELPGAGRYPSELAEAVEFKTKLIGGKYARVSVVGEGRTEQGRWREVGKLLDDGYFYHPAWGHWRSVPPPSYLRQNLPAGPRMVDKALDRSEPEMRDQIRSILTDYLDRLADIRKALA